MMIIDASPWGMGGVLEVNGSPKAFFAEELTTKHAKILQISIGQASSQQVAEAFAIMIALRMWSKTWLNQRAVLEVKSDSVSALNLLLNMKTSGPGNCLIAREIALDLAQSVYQPQVVSHISGLANVTADQLSRVYSPGSSHSVPDHLKKIWRSYLSNESTIFRTLDSIPRCIVP